MRRHLIGLATGQAYRSLTGRAVTVGASARIGAGPIDRLAGFWGSGTCTPWRERASVSMVATPSTGRPFTYVLCWRHPVANVAEPPGLRLGRRVARCWPLQAGLLAASSRKHLSAAPVTRPVLPSHPSRPRASATFRRVIRQPRTSGIPVYSRAKISLSRTGKDSSPWSKQPKTHSQTPC